MSSPIFKVLTGEQWQRAKAEGVFLGAPVDLKDGFIHFSCADQLQETIEKHFSGQPDLVIAAVDPEALGDSLKWEISRGGAEFPHLYGKLNVADVVWSASFRP